MSSRADSHDLDKLARWHCDLSAGAPGQFPVCAIFLVSADDQAAHDVFRKFRSSFEARHAGFEHLVIFGQHGVSSAALSLLDEFGLPQGAIPTLALLAISEAATVYTLPLPPGESDKIPPGQTAETWQDALVYVERAIDRGERRIDLASLPGVVKRQLGDGSLDKLVGKLLNSLS